MIPASLLVFVLSASPAFASLAARAPTRTLSASSTVAATATLAPTGSFRVQAPAPTSYATSPLSNLATIGTATTSEITSPLPSTYTAGAIGPVSGAPPLPAITGINPAAFPALDIHAPGNSAQVLQWISEINLAGAPKIPITGMGGCQNVTANSAAIAAAGASGNCWWTCGGCSRATDITFCPEKNTWGLSYDDGPSPYTPRLLQFLANAAIKTTFFIVGSRAISRPQMLQTEYMEGHQLSVHTWSHPYLTTLSNEQIVAELGWTKKIIKDITGVTPNTMRPPYGDIDDRVRYIALQMGLTPIIWTSYQANTFDTRDWQIGGGIVNATAVYMNFERYLGTAATSLSTGFVVLAHDLYQQSVELAVNYVLPAVLNANTLKLMPIITCLGSDLSQAYIETANNRTLVTQTTATLAGASGIGFVSGVASTSSVSTATAPGSTPSGSSGGSSGQSGSSSSSSSTAKAASGERLSMMGSLLALVAGILALA